MKSKSHSVDIEPDKKASANHQMVVEGNIPIQNFTESKVGGIRGVGTNGDPPGDDITIAHQDVDSLIPLEDQVESIPLAK